MKKCSTGISQNGEQGRWTEAQVWAQEFFSKMVGSYEINLVKRNSGREKFFSKMVGSYEI